MDERTVNVVVGYAERKGSQQPLSWNLVERMLLLSFIKNFVVLILES